MKNILYTIVTVLCVSCFEEDDMVTPHDPGDLTTGTVEMTENYKYQAFFDLETNSTISKNLVTDWDLGFEASDSGWHVILNTSRMMLAGNTFNSEFSSVTGNEDVTMVFDSPTLSVDSTAIGEWYSVSDDKPVSNSFTYLIDMGVDESGRLLGKKKASFDFTEDDSYTIRFANLDGSGETYDTIVKNSVTNFVCYSFENGIVDIEPDKKSWDLMFTKYSIMLYSDGEPYPYLLTGVFLNPNNVEANMNTEYEFEEISYDTINSIPLKKQKDIIGYDWKIYDFDNERYSIDTEKKYILKDNSGYYYKLRFIDFYSSTGEKGYPTFEYIRL